MTRTTVIRSIQAPIDKVFRTVADIREFSQVVPHIVNVEFLSETQYGLGTRFRETRVMKGREAATDLEVTEFVEDERVRLVADSHGTIWDTVFSVQKDGEAVTLTMVMDARPYKLLQKIMVPLIRGMVQKEIEKDMDFVKQHCEQAE